VRWPNSTLFTLSIL